MQYVNGVIEACDIHYPEGSSSITNPNFPCSAAHHCDRLPIIRIVPMLHLVELVSGVPPGRCREGPQIVQRAAPELYRLEMDHRKNYTIFCIEPQLPWREAIAAILRDAARKRGPQDDGVVCGGSTAVTPRLDPGYSITL